MSAPTDHNVFAGGDNGSRMDDVAMTDEAFEELLASFNYGEDAEPVVGSYGCVLCSVELGHQQEADCAFADVPWAPEQYALGNQFVTPQQPLSFSFASGDFATPAPIRTFGIPSDAAVARYTEAVSPSENLLNPTGFVRLPQTTHGLPVRGTPAQQSQTQTASPVSPSQPVSYSGQFGSFSEAHGAIHEADGNDPLVPLNIENDDWQQVKTPEMLHAYAARLFQALQELPQTAPDMLIGDDMQQYWSEHQANKLRSIQDFMKTEPRKAEARILICLEEIISLHEHGCPQSIFARTTMKRGYRLEQDFNCTERIEKIIEVASGDKYVANDILIGSNLQELIRSPAAYWRRKVENSRVNARKAAGNKELAKMGKTSGTQVKTGRIAKRSANVRGKGVKSPASTASGTPMSGGFDFGGLPSSPTPMMPNGYAPHPIFGGDEQDFGSPGMDDQKFDLR